MEHGDDPPPGGPAAGNDETVPLRGSGMTPHGDAAAATAPAAALAPELAPGDRIGRFVLLEQLGAGGMGVVFAARDSDLGRKVAIKVLRRRRDGHMPEAAMRARLLREAQAIARLSHRNVVTVHEVGTIEQGPAAGQVFLAMELIDGETLTRWQRAPHTWREIVETYLQAARGLAAAHAAGLVHRDFKPDNAIVGRDGEVRVTDFGLASIAGADDAQQSPERAASPDEPGGLEASRLTSTGDVMGTPLYMAPEQRAGRAVDARADQYAFCVALYRAVHGVFPFGTDSEEILARRAEKLELAPAGKRRVPRAVQRALVRGLAPEPSARWPDMGALSAALSAALGVRRRRFLAGGAIAVAGGAIAAVLVARAAAPAAAACASGAAELAAVWNADARQRGSAGFAASGLPRADDAWRRVERAVDDWGREWATSYDDACRTTRDRRAPEAVQVRRQACLAGKRDVLAGLVDAWSRADRELAGRGVDVALRLPRVSDCAANRRVEAIEAVAGAAELRAAVTELQVASIAGRFTAALPAAREALARARALGDRALEAEVGLWLGRMERQAAEQSARTTLFDAAAAAEAAGRDDLAVEAWAEWIYVAASVGVAEPEIEAASRRADAALRRAGDDRRLRGLLRNNQGVAAYEARRDRDAIALFDEAVAIRRELFGERDPRIAEVLDNLGNAWGGLAGTTTGAEHADARARALALARQALDIRIEAFGETSAITARSLNNVGTELEAAGLLDEAEDHLRRALAAKEATLGAEHPGIGTTLVNLAGVLERRDRLDDALATYARAAKLWDRPEGAGVGPLCTPLNGMISTLSALGRPAEAIAPADRCAALRAGDPPKHRSQRRAAAVARLEAGETAAAAAALRDLVAEEAEAYAVDDPRRARALIALARAELASGRAAEAAATIARAARLAADDAKATPAQHADVALTTAEIDHARGRAAAARTGAAAALALCEPADACGSIEHTFRRRAAALGVGRPGE